MKTHFPQPARWSRHPLPSRFSHCEGDMSLPAYMVTAESVTWRGLTGCLDAILKVGLLFIHSCWVGAGDASRKWASLFLPHTCRHLETASWGDFILKPQGPSRTMPACFLSPREPKLYKKWLAQCIEQSRQRRKQPSGWTGLRIGENAMRSMGFRSLSGPSITGNTK